MKRKSLVILPLLFFIFSCSKANENLEQKWFKGNLHTHSYWSDGDEFPEVIMDYYNQLQYYIKQIEICPTIRGGWTKVF